MIGDKMDIKLRKDIILMNINEIKPYKNNSKIHTKEQITKLAENISKFGFDQPIVIDENNEIIKGHCRLLSAKELGLNEVPVLKIIDLTNNEKKLLRISDNKISELGSWDDEILKSELSEFDYEFVKNIGFDSDEFNGLLGLNEYDELKDTIENPEKIQTDIKLDDMFQLGRHKLLCGDCCNKEDVNKLMDDNKVDMIFTDPPYGVFYENKIKEIYKDNSYNKIKNDELNINSISNNVWLPSFKNMYDVSKDDCSFYVTMPQGGDQMMMMMSTHWNVKHELIWVKPSPVFSMNRLDYDYQHEPIMYGWKKKHNWYGKGKFTKSIWNIARDTEKLHPTMKPVELIINAILNSSKENDIVLDLFGGSGSTLIACEQTNRNCFMMELDPVYCQIIINRWQNFTNKKAVKLN